MFGLPMQVVVGAGILVLVLLMVMTVVARMYRKAGPNEALIVYGMGGTHVYSGRGAIIFPMVQTCRDLSLELMSFDVAPQQNLYTKQGVAVTVEAVAQIKVKSDKESILTAAEQFLSKRPEQREALIRLVMEGHLRGIIGQLTVEQIVKEPEMVGDRMRSTCADDMSKMGLEVVSFTIKEVRDKNDYITNMGRPDVARIKRDAEIARRERELIATVLKQAEIERQRIETLANAERQRLITEAEGRASSIRAQGEAEAEIIFKKGEAEAKAMNVKAEAYQEYNQAAVIDKLFTNMPEVVKALASPLANVDKITIVSTGNGDASGMNKITGDITKMAAQVPALFETLSGMSMSELFAKVRTIGDKGPKPPDALPPSSKGAGAGK